MTARHYPICLAACLLLLAAATKARAQDAFCGPGCDFDMQMFAPVDFDYDCRPIRKNCGVYFSYEKLSWTTLGVRTPVGSPNAQVLSEDIFPSDLALSPDFVQPPPQYTIINGGQNVPPFSEFALGDRYELGYFRDGVGYSIGVLDGPVMNQAQTLGSGEVDGDGNPTPSAVSGFGSIHINFDLSSPGLLLGFRDYGGVVTNGAEIPTETQGGPGVGGDGVIDDLNGNLRAGAGFTFIDVDASGDFNDGDIITGVFYDYGDLTEFNVRFNQLTVHNSTRTRGVELMKFHDLNNRHRMATNYNQQVQLGYGVRFLQMNDSFGINGTSYLFRGRNFVNTDVQNQLVGPQIRAQWSIQKKRVRLGADARFMFAYNVQNFSQKGTLAEGNVVGGLNQPLILQPNSWSYGRQQNNFSPLVELRADASFQITSALAFKLGYTAIFIDNVSRAASVTKWSLPDMGFLPGGKQDVFINGINAGVEATY